MTVEEIAALPVAKLAAPDAQLWLWTTNAFLFDCFGIIKAWERVRPTVPTFFSIHGTGEAEAVALVRERLGLEPFDLMEDAVKAAVEAAR